MATALHPLPALRRLPAWHLALSLAAAARVELALRRRSLPETARALGLVVAAPSAPSHGSGEPAPDAPLARLPRWTSEPLRATAAVMRRWPLGQDGPPGSAMCLRRSLVLARRLRSLDPVVRIGVAPGDHAARVRAHAWVEVGGLALDASAHEYTPLTSLVPAVRVGSAAP